MTRMRSEARVDAARSAFAAIGVAIAERGYAIAEEFLPSSVVAALAAEARRRDAAGELRPAGIGRGSARLERTNIRGDRIGWLDANTPEPPEAPLWVALESLRLALNEMLLLGLYEIEAHYALYPPGARYRRHRDRFRDDDARLLSCVLYLNDGWTPADGGALRIHTGAESDAALDVLPAGGTFVCFLSDLFEHEVLPSPRERLSIAGWFRRRV